MRRNQLTLPISRRCGSLRFSVSAAAKTEKRSWMGFECAQFRSGAVRMCICRILANRSEHGQDTHPAPPAALLMLGSTLEILPAEVWSDSSVLGCRGLTVAFSPSFAGAAHRPSRHPYRRNFAQPFQLVPAAFAVGGLIESQRYNARNHSR